MRTEIERVRREKKTLFTKEHGLSMLQQFPFLMIMEVPSSSYLFRNNSGIDSNNIRSHPVLY